VLNEGMTPEMPDRPLRLFVAIPVPATIRDALARPVREFQALAPRGAVRWTNPEQIHLTLKFLGDVPASQVEALKKSVRMAAASHQAIALRAQGFGFFPNDRSPRVIWAGVVDPEDRLRELQKSVAEAVQPFTREPDGEGFTGHLTLGRFKSFHRREIRELMEHAGKMRDRPFGEWQAGEIQIIRSEMSVAGARHTVTAQFCLVEKK
jgi:2'-5' RNA ligase